MDMRYVALLLLVGVASGTMIADPVDTDEDIEGHVMMYDHENDHAPIALVPKIRDSGKNMKAWRSIAVANKLFAHRLFRAVAKATDVGENFFISPYAVSAGLSMTLLGARGNTAHEIKEVLGYTEILVGKDKIHRLYQKMEEQLMNRDFNFTLISPNRFYGDVQESFSQQYQDDVTKYYGATVEKVDFKHHPQEAVEQMNEWVSDVTKGTITEAVSPDSVTPDTILTLVSTLYFQGAWENPFTSKKPGVFHLDRDNQVTVNYMTGQFNVRYSEAFELGVYWLELPYITTDSQYKMVMELILPVEEEPDAKFLRILEGRLTEDTLDWAIRHKTLTPMTVLLPEFSLEYGTDLQPVLHSMGIEDLFDNGSVDLTGISPHNNVALNSAQHKTFLKVDPTGTTASASFSQTQTRTSHYMKFDRPFLVIIRERYTKMPMFMGRIANPVA